MFNSAQKEAINHFKGPMMVLAGAGSGKTTIITNRIKKLVYEHGVSEDEILVVTFTATAAGEMKKRYEYISGKKNSMINFGTFHRIFFSILREEFSLNGDNIIRQDFKYEILKNLLIKYRIDYDDERETINELSGEIAKIKEGIKKYSSGKPYSEYFKDIYIEYKNELRSNKLIDFEDMELIVHNLFVDNEKKLDKWKNRFKFILIDEFQDINPIQFKIIKLLLDDEKNIFIVGDDDQSIYGFRGSDPTIMLNFPVDFPDTKVVYLEYNYRSTQNIINASGRLIKKNKNRYDKTYKTVNEDGKRVEIKSFDSDREELQELCEKIRFLKKNGEDYSDMAILIRTNSRLGFLTFMLNRMTIPFTAKEHIPNIFDNFAIKDIVAYLKLAIDKGDEGELLRVINKPVRYITNANVIESSGSLKKLEFLYRSNIHIKGNIITLREDLNNIKDQSPEMAIKYILNVINYGGFIKEFCESKFIDDEEVTDRINALIALSSGLKNIDELLIAIENHINNMSDKKFNVDNEGVNIMTIHASKGLEYKYVFIPDVNEDIIPHKRNEDVEEERRLMYVAMTRAIKELHIYYSNKIGGKTIGRSRFIDEILN